MKKSRKQIEKQIKKFIKELELGVTLEDVKEIIWNEETMEDYQQLIKMCAEKALDMERANEVCQIVSDAWNNFPHKSLDGLSPMEVAERFKKRKRNN